MPIVSRFFGITIRVNPRDHSPPHFHAKYGENEASVEIATGKILVGSLPARARRLVGEWLEIHRAEILENWDCLQNGRPGFDIEPLR